MLRLHFALLMLPNQPLVDKFIVFKFWLIPLFLKLRFSFDGTGQGHNPIAKNCLNKYQSDYVSPIFYFHGDILGWLFTLIMFCGSSLLQHSRHHLVFNISKILGSLLFRNV